MPDTQAAPAWDRHTVPPLALDLIAKLEAFRPEAYQDSVGVWTVGYGTTVMPTGRRVVKGDTLRQGDARLLLGHQAQAWVGAIARHVSGALTAGQAAALVSWVHNLGEGSLTGSTLAAMVNARRADLAAWQLPGWIIAGGAKSLGLMRRRELERRIWCGGSLADYDAVWKLGEAAFEPTYALSFADAAAFHAGREAALAAVANRATPALNPGQSRVAPAQPAVRAGDDGTDALNDAELARHQP